MDQYWMVIWLVPWTAAKLIPPVLLQSMMTISDFKSSPVPPVFLLLIRDLILVKTDVTAVFFTLNGPNNQ